MPATAFARTTTRNVRTAAVRQTPTHGLLLMNLFELVRSCLGLGIGLYAWYSAGGGPDGLFQSAVGFWFGTAVSGLIPGLKEAHANPDISTASAIRNRDWRQLAYRWPGQFIGWWLVVYIGLFLYREKVPASNFGVAAPLEPTWWLYAGLVAMAGVFVLAFVAVYVTEIAGVGLAGGGNQIIALLLGFLVFYTASRGGGGLNAARELAPAIFAWQLPLAVFVGGRLGGILAGLATSRIPSRV